MEETDFTETVRPGGHYVTHINVHDMSLWKPRSNVYCVWAILLAWPCRMAALNVSFFSHPSKGAIMERVTNCSAAYLIMALVLGCLSLNFHHILAAALILIKTKRWVASPLTRQRR
jgi:hypothetical protein